MIEPPPPASDETYYNIKRLHVVFALSSAALLAVTVWMIAADHFRPWKVYQRTYIDRVEPWLTEARIRRERTEAFLDREEELTGAVEEARKAVAAAGESIDGLEESISTATLRRENAERALRFCRAELDEARSHWEAGVGRALAGLELDALARRVDRLQEELQPLSAEFDRATADRDALVGRLAEVTRPVDIARKALADHRGTLARLDRALARQQPNWGKRLLRLPLLDALGRPLAIDQIWLPDLPIDYHFSKVARFDRCRTCHRAIDKTSPGSPFEAACGAEKTLTLRLATPSEAPQPEEDQDGRPTGPTLESIYGFDLASEGILDPQAATVGLVRRLTPAAEARLEPGDVISTIGGKRVAGRTDAIAMLTSDVPWGEPLELEIRRGLPHPYRSHPRPDLFAGASSPHPAGRFGCTICHGGQGSATSFEFASHAPNDLTQRADWRGAYGWSPNRHWDFPMRPARFAQSGCLQCHHEVVDLEAGERFADPPAPKLLAGYRLVRENGCFGCHEIRGIDGSGRRIGPDMRLEPNYAEAALELLADPGLTDPQRSLAREVVRRPEDAGPRRALVAAIEDVLASGPSAGSAVLKPRSAAMLDLLAAEEPVPGSMRKVGPSLRDAAGKLDAVFLDAWSSDPGGFRPGTRMPSFFGLHEHLDGQGLADAERFEAVEIRAVSEYLLAASQRVEPLGPPPGVTEPPSAQRGRQLFEIHGCLACHQHEAFGAGQSVFGPDLSNLGSKLRTPAGADWLAGWIRDPVHHAPRTLMPNPLLEPVPLPEPNGSEGEPARLTDPAADIAAFLLSFDAWEPPPRRPLVESDLDELALEHLGKTFSRKIAKEYLAAGIPESMAGEVPPAAAELLGPITLAKKLRYVGRSTIGKRGCFACHDVPGFEDAQPIGPALSDWGRKHESLLAFEQVHRFLAVREAGEPKGDAGGPESDASDRAFFRQAVEERRREGFIWQKLEAPRSFDYKVAENRRYNERLTMGRFSLDAGQREAIITFVLGLVADPPPEQYVHNPDRRGRAIVRGRHVLQKHGCDQCHTLNMERWTFEYDPEEFEPPISLPDYAFLAPQFTPDEVARSMRTDRRGRGQAEVVGMPRVDAFGQLLEDVDDDDNPLYFFTLWEPAVIHGEICAVGGSDVMISEPQIIGKRPPWGGAFARLLYPAVLAAARATGSGASELEAWGWVPPPLAAEGAKVRPGWLYDYLLEPFTIRPAAVLRMPKYNLAPGEAAALVDYFAATAGAEFPYSAHPRSRAAQRATRPLGPPQVLDDAMRLVTDRQTYCAKCHLIGDFSPGGEIRTVLAPNLEGVGGRIRGEYLRRWLANPRTELPYTAMPVNFPPDGRPLSEDHPPETSLEQLEAVHALLLNYDWYLRRSTSVSDWIESAEPTPPSDAD